MSIFHKRAHQGEDEAWLMTYADMITLLLCFFVLFLSTMEPKQARLEALVEGLKGEFTRHDTGTNTPFMDLYDSLGAIIEENQLERDVALEEKDGGLEMEFSSAAFYEPGSADFKPQAIPILTEVAKSLAGFQQEGYMFTVEGHTDDTPIRAPLYPSNWELSTNRATHVVRFFIKAGIPPNKLRAAGYAASRPKAPNRDAEGKAIPENQNINRRVVVILRRAE